MKRDIHQIGNSTILLAGHETSATTLCWVLLELARNPSVQNKLRDEIRTMEHAIHARGDSDFAATDLDNMPYLSAVIKVVQISFNHLIFC
jgi:cytochrome P450